MLLEKTATRATAMPVLLLCLLLLETAAAAFGGIFDTRSSARTRYPSGASSGGVSRAMVSTSTTAAEQDEQEVSSLMSSSAPSPSLVRSVNYFISRKCNYQCKFCFHTAKSYDILSQEQSTQGLRMLAEAGCEKINLAGGEPFLHPILLGELCRTASEELGLAVSIISNGSKITPEWMNAYANYVDVLGVSVDSFDQDTNAAIGRGGDADNRHIERMLQVRNLCSQHNVRFKLNTVVNALNWQEDMNEHIEALDPFRWKVFQVLLLEGENAGGDGDLRDARDLCIEREKFDAFVDRHANRQQLIPESNDVMQNSYLLLDEKMRFLDCSSGAKVPGRSILNVGVETALMDAGFDHSMFHERGGVFEWSRPKKRTVP